MKCSVIRGNLGRAHHHPGLRPSSGLRHSVSFRKAHFTAILFDVESFQDVHTEQRLAEVRRDHHFHIPERKGSKLEFLDNRCASCGCAIYGQHCRLLLATNPCGICYSLRQRDVCSACVNNEVQVLVVNRPIHKIAPVSALCDDKRAARGIIRFRPGFCWPGRD